MSSPKTPPTDLRAIDSLLQIMKNLRDPDGGCPWDVEQDFNSVAPYAIEEAYEVNDAIERQNFDDLREELGDLLLQIVFHATMAEEQGRFNFADVVEAINAKMVRRHPHVFERSDGRDAVQQTKAWEDIKAKERLQKNNQEKSLLSDIAVNLPAMTRAVKLQNRAARVGFDWPDIRFVFDKYREEMEELEQARHQKDPEQIKDEFGDLLFVMANLARHLEIDPEAALRRTNEKFIKRFSYVEQAVKRSGKSWDTYTLDGLEAFWQDAKKQS